MNDARAERRFVSRGRRLVLVAAALLVLSVTLLLIASTSPARFEEGKLSWEGIVDVVTAFILVVMSFILHRATIQTRAF